MPQEERETNARRQKLLLNSLESGHSMQRRQGRHGFANRNLGTSFLSLGVDNADLGPSRALLDQMPQNLFQEAVSFSLNGAPV